MINEQLFEEVTNKKCVRYEIICDQCKKRIALVDTRDEYRAFNNSGFVSYWSLTTGHHDWGNDSIDSVESFNLCSPECISVKLEEYLKRSDKSFNSEYFDLRHEYQLSCWEE